MNELDQYDDAELVRKKTAAMFAGFVTRQSPEDALLGEGPANGEGVALAGLEPGTLQILKPGEDIKFSDPADVGGSYAEFLRTQFRAVASAMAAMRAGLMSRSEAISAFGYDAEAVDAEIAADNRRADGLGLVFDSDPRRGATATAVTGSQAPGGDAA